MIETTKLKWDCEFYSDQSRIEQVLVNLVGNSIKFIQNSNGRIKLKVKQSKKNKNFLKFIVADNGTGIKPEVQK